ncbi:MAG TPA: hypothetical protein VJR47_13045 [Stellaceae bacterium]|nr:hypothetical protein [Stellaceae bacterium]
MAKDKPLSALREAIEDDETDPRIMTKLDLLENLYAAAETKDGKAIMEAARKLKAHQDDMLAEGKKLQAAMAAALDKAKAVADPEKRTTELLAAFEFSAKVQFEAYDVLDDKETGDAAVVQAHAIAEALDAIPPGRRAALAKFLDSPDDGVLVMAAIHLKKIMLDRVTPILREIEERQSPSSIGFAAMWALPPDPSIEVPKPKGGAKEKS